MNRKSDTLYLWLTFVDEVRDDHLVLAYRKLASVQELKRMERFHHEKHQVRFIIGRAVARTVLSQFTGTPPELITFYKTSYGRPYLQQQEQHQRISFSISYTEDLIAFALSVGGNVGVDVEYTAVEIDCLEIARQQFSAPEYNDLINLPHEQHKERFFQYWTLKESYIKARGLGLNLPLNIFGFVMPSAESKQIRLVPPPDDKQRNWFFESMQLRPDYQCALAFQRPTEAPVRVEMKHIVPLLYERDFQCLKVGFAD
jgi:4'-phosphopantetheinyl transferase